MECPVNVDLEDPRPVGERILPRLDVRARDAGRGDKHVDRPVRRFGRARGLGDIRGIRDIDRAGDHVPARALRRFLGKVEIKVPDFDRGAACREALDDRLADALGAPGHHRNMTVEVDLVHSVPL
jgi:hypothetical protein